jgi:hypothetical protein
MKNFILILMFSLVSFYTYSQSNKTLVKSFTNTYDNILVDVQCDKKINYWQNNFVRIELNISTDFSEQLLSSLVKTQRYDFAYTNENNQTIITLPNINREIIVGGKKITERINMVIWLPETKQLPTETTLQ